MNKAKMILDLNHRWNETDSNSISDNVEQLLEEKSCDTFASKLEKLVEITGSSEHAVYAWLNHGRKNVKIPFLKVCKIAMEYNVDVERFLEVRTMFEKKFAVSHVKGNDETIIKFFREDEKEAAKSYGYNIRKNYDGGVIEVFLARFDENGNIKDNEREVFEVYDTKD